MKDGVGAPVQVLHTAAGFAAPKQIVHTAPEYNGYAMLWSPFKESLREGLGEKVFMNGLTSKDLNFLKKFAEF